ncbi:MAG TPA: small multi-drug export protein, partial [Planctomycetota bacterium]|nr:small multi-drug export protein [Planctomycetota bacterium]
MDARRRTLLILPWAVTAALAAVLAAVLPARTMGHLLAAAGLSFFALGKLVILAPAVDPGTPLSLLALAGLAIYLDLLTVLTVGPHLALLHRIPWMGRRLQALEADMHATLDRRPWVRRWTLLSVAFFVIVPLAGMGALGATILGRMSGLSFRALFWAATAGSVVGSGLMLLFAGPALR